MRPSIQVTRSTASLLLIATALAARPDPARAQPPSPAPIRTSISTSTSGSTSAQSPLGTSPFLGGVPTGAATSEPMRLTVIDAILRALDHNLGVLTAEEALGRARGTRWMALAQLLPNVNARVSETRQKINLAAFGFGGAGGPSFPGVSDIVGPFNVFDLRLYVSQSIYDPQAINDLKSETHALEATRLLHQSARDFVIHVAGNAYIQALAASARADAARAQMETAETLHRQAVDLKQSGIIAGIDVLRAQVQFIAQQQRAAAAINEFEKQKLVLGRLIGLPLGQQITLETDLPELPAAVASLDDAVERAYKTRPDYLAALERVRAAESTRAAAVGAQLPSVQVNADVGQIGFTPADSKQTFAVSGSVNVPLFNGRNHGRLIQADADLRARRSEAEDIKAAIYYELRGAFLDLDTTGQQLRVAQTARDLASEQLTQARDRFAAGVASNVEVVQAQEAVALATEQFISAQYGFDLAKGAVIRGTGLSEIALRQITGGSR